MAECNNKNFVYLNWKPSTNTHHRYLKDSRSTVEVTTSVGTYKNSYGDLLMQKNHIYYWEVKIIQGTYFKIGIIKDDHIDQIKKKAFSDISQGYAYFSTGQLRNGSNTTGVAFGSGYGPGDTIKVQFNSKEGNLKFGKNEDPMKVAFTDAQFKKGGYVPAVAALIENSKYSLTIPGLQD